MDGIHKVKRVVVAVIGGTVLLIGLLAVFLPFVPAFIIIPAGFAILATQFLWARRWLKKTKRMIREQLPKNGEKRADR
jgi:uncharacterized membrane protein YbaN (DUF454 family)